MSRCSTWLLEHKRNVHSQTGEDGIIEKILEIVPRNDKWCVEFGAWDGRFLTNTRHLIESRGYSAVLIEADPKKFTDLRRSYSQRADVISVNRLVGFADDDNSLDQILGNTPVPHDFDVLSIDIDGNDYHVWKSVVAYEPKVVIAEFNPTVPTHIRFVQTPDPSINHGSSLLSLVELGREKGYELVSVLPFNAIFVKSEYYQLFDLESNAPEVLRTDLSSITYLFSGFDGRVFLRGACRLPWHDIAMNESSGNQLPRVLQRYPGNYTWFQRQLFSLYRRLRRRSARPSGFSA